MKIPSKLSDERRQLITKDYYEAARKCTLEYGVFVDVNAEYEDNFGVRGKMTNIFFSVMKHRFDGTRDLRKALRNKAFL